MWDGGGPLRLLRWLLGGGWLLRLHCLRRSLLLLRLLYGNGFSVLVLCRSTSDGSVAGPAAVSSGRLGGRPACLHGSLCLCNGVQLPA